MADMGKTHRGDEEMTTPLGCKNCAELVCSLEYYVNNEYGEIGDDRSCCPSCGGRLLIMQEAFDYILHLKRTLEEAGVEYEYDET